MPEISERSAAAAAWEGAQSNEEAVENLLAAMHRDPALYRAVMERHERQAATEAVGRIKRAQRHYIWSRPAAPDNRVHHLTRMNAVSLLDMRLPSGQRLGDATRAEVIEARDYYRVGARNLADKATFLDTVAAKMPAAKTARVAHVLSVHELEEIRDAA